jgi:hypothetical protein
MASVYNGSAQAEVPDLHPTRIVMDETQTVCEIAAELGSEQDIRVSRWFGMACLKVGGKVFAGRSGSDMVSSWEGRLTPKRCRLTERTSLTRGAPDNR